MKRNILLVAILTLFLSACSTKEVFEPQVVGDDWDRYENTDIIIKDTSSNIALLEDQKVLTEDGVLDLQIDPDKRVISLSDSWVISASIDGNMTLESKEDTSVVKNFNLKKTVAGASVEGNILAVLFADNEMALYDVDTQATLFKEQGGKFVAVDSRIVNPYFMRGIVLFATLDGKVVFVDTKRKKRLRTVIVSSEEKFNNVISMSVIDNKIVAATGYKILSMAKKETRVKYEIRNIVYGDKTIYIATKQGEVISLTPDLQVISKIKFPFAHFYAMTLVDGKLYILEKEGYMIVVDATSFDYSVHDVDLDDGFIFTDKSSFYIDEKKILTE